MYVGRKWEPEPGLDPTYFTSFVSCLRAPTRVCYFFISCLSRQPTVSTGINPLPKQQFVAEQNVQDQYYCRSRTVHGSWTKKVRACPAWRRQRLTPNVKKRYLVLNPPPPRRLPPPAGWRQRVGDGRRLLREQDRPWSVRCFRCRRRRGQQDRQAGPRLGQASQRCREGRR